MREYFTFNGKQSTDFEVWISGNGIYRAPERDIDTVQVPGRCGELTLDNGRFRNVDITYPAFIFRDFRQNFNAFKEYMLSMTGYRELQDTYDPDHYRMARFIRTIEPEMMVRNKMGQFDIVFNCDPRRFLINGKDTKIFSSGGTIRNQTLYDALPLIRAYGTGSLTISGITVTISSANEYTDIDCELQEAYKGSTNCNNNISLTNGEFPRLVPGSNSISFTGLSRIEITPRWWQV